MDETRRAVAAGVRLLARRDRSEAEIARRLAEKGFSATGVEGALARLRALGYLDDRRFARHWADSTLRNGRGFGPRIRHELMQRGVDAAIVAEVLSELADEYEEAALLTEIVTRKFPHVTAGPVDEREKLRIMRYLQRRGFSTTAVLALFRDIQGC